MKLGNIYIKSKVIRLTEKRFGMIKTKTYGLYVPVDKMKVYNFSSFESELDCIRVVNALNDLEEKSRENGKIASKYLEENEQLKIRFNEEREKSLKFCRNIDTLTIENEHIKNTIQEAYHNERTQLGKSVLKQLMETIQ